jgi:UDP-N-acetylglucosamine--N-acetylmuramyl-(pentapeptide) pyrophosphoryl-undecaprenol N-acetylglucosamine transferase
MEKFFDREKIKLTGNPVRKELMNLPYERDEALLKLKLDPLKKTVLIVGGSLGARGVNNAVEASLKEFLEPDKFQVIWQCGKIYKSELEKKYGAKRGLLLVDFIHDMPLFYAAADLIVSRSGAMSVSELAIIGKPVIFMPSPNVAEDHQTKNALALYNMEAARMLSDVEAVEELAFVVVALLLNEKVMSQLKENIAAFAMPNATSEIVDTLIEVVYGRA